MVKTEKPAIVFEVTTDNWCFNQAFNTNQISIFVPCSRKDYILF